MKAIESVRPSFEVMTAMLAAPALAPRIQSLLDLVPIRRRRRYAPALAFGAREALIATALMAAVLASLGVAITLYGRRRGRSSEAEDVRAKISETLLSQPTVSGLPLTAFVRVPLWWRSPVTLEIKGPVPTAEVRDAVLQTVARELTRWQTDVRLKDRIVVDPSEFEHGHLEVIPG
jgi:hypothetical protein